MNLSSKDRPVFVVGDVHGQYAKVVKLLREAGLVGPRLEWSGADAALWFMGDFFDRGANGLASLDLVMRLQAEAAPAGGQVESLIGNHEILILAAWLFPREMTVVGRTFLDDWLINGGQKHDLAGLTMRHMDWIINRPAMAHVAGRLFMHADSLLYADCGSSVAEVNACFKTVLQSRSTLAYDRFLGRFGERLAFMDKNTGDDAAGAVLAERFLRHYGGSAIVHGHTPIGPITGKHNRDVHEPLIYAKGLCVNVDGGMYRGGPGFVYRLPEQGSAA